MHEVFRNATPATPAFGGWITFDSVGVVEQLAGAGFDYLGIDTQHTILDTTAAIRLFYAVPQDGPPILVRIAANNAADIGKLLDFGADGVIVPMIETASDAEKAVAACRYAPSGVRSFGPARPHIGRDPNTLQGRAACFVMIETTEAVANIEAIVATPGLTGVYFGPVDLAISAGLAPSSATTAESQRGAAKRVAQACRAANVIAACPGISGAHAKDMIAAGFAMVTLNADRGYLAVGAAALLAEMKA